MNGNSGEESKLPIGRQRKQKCVETTLNSDLWCSSCTKYGEVPNKKGCSGLKVKPPEAECFPVELSCPVPRKRVKTERFSEQDFDTSHLSNMDRPRVLEGEQSTQLNTQSTLTAFVRKAEVNTMCDKLLSSQNSSSAIELNPVVPLTDVRNVLNSITASYGTQIDTLKTELQKNQLQLVQTKKSLNEAKLELALQISQKTLDSIRSSVRPSITALVGDGFGSDRSLRRYTKDVVDVIKEKCGPENYVKQLELAQAVASKLSVTISAGIPEKDVKVALAVVDSIRSFCNTLKEKHKGRYTNSNRAAFQGLCSALALDGEDHTVSLARKAAAVGVKAKHLTAARNRFEDWISGDMDYLVALRGKQRADKTPDEVVEFIIESWCDESITRESECTTDVLKAQWDRKTNTTLYRIRFMESPQYVLANKIIAMVAKNFPAEYKYADGSIGSAPFSIGKTFVEALKPFFVQEKDRALCLCHYHLEWDYICGALWTYRKALKEQRLCFCSCENSKDSHSIYRQLLCPYAEFADRKCLHGDCMQCQGLLGLKMCEEEKNQQLQVKWMRWGTVEYVDKKGDTKTKSDFCEVRTPIGELLQKLKDIKVRFAVHHDCMKWQAADWHYVQENLPRKYFASVQDFSENLALEVAMEHQSKYYTQVGVTLYGAVLLFNIEDVQDSFIERAGWGSGAAIIDHFNCHHLPHIIYVTVCVVSDDLKHNPAFVQHVNDKIISPWVKSEVMDEQPIGHLARSDGAPTQFDNCHQYVWISKHQAKIGWKLDWSLHCECHGKDKVDPELGTGKNIIRVAQLEQSTSNCGHQISNYTEVAQKLIENWEHPKTHFIYARKCKGVFARKVFSLPAKLVKQHIQRGQTVTGSKPCRQFSDVGVEGDVLMGYRSCHMCPGCLLLNPLECKNTVIAGPRDVVHLKAEGGKVVARVSESKLQERGRELAQDIQPGQIIVVELAHENQPWMLGVVEESCLYTVEKDFKCWFGEIKAGDEVVDVQKLEPNAPGSKTFHKTDRIFPVFVEDIRMINVVMMDKSRGKAADQRGKYELSEETRAHIDALMYT